MNRLMQTPSGFTLVEFMIAILIGSLILVGVTSIFISSSRSFRTQEAVGEVQESGRFLHFMVFPFIRQAGYLADPLLQVDPTTVFIAPANRLLDNRRALFGVDEANGANAVGVNAKTGTDIIVVRYLGKSLVLGGANSDGSIRACHHINGGAANPNNALTDAEMAENVFYVTEPDPTTGLSSLNCRAQILNAATGAAVRPANPIDQPLINNVHSMEVLYGVDTDTSDDLAANGTSGLLPNQYFEADEIPNLIAGIPGWQRVVSVKIEVTTISETRSEGSIDNDPDDDRTDQGAVLVQDGRIQRLFSGTIQIRNRMRS